MNTKESFLMNGNQATAHIAYRVNEVCAIYPITPSSEMSELVEAWSSKEQTNIFGDIPNVFEMQSEAGVAGAMHGALQTGALSTTFTASQGLLLMQPNMYKIAGELTPNVIHVATRSIATHALSVFGDHSDIMAVRNTGYAFLGAASVQEAMDFALIAQAATLASRIPFVHFMDGFRTSHEMTNIELVSDDIIRKMLPLEKLEAHNTRKLNPNAPLIRGTAQGPDVFFQSREAINSYYEACPHIVQQQMDKFAQCTGRHYHLFDYVGHPEATEVIVIMASAGETVATTVQHLNAYGAKVGVLIVRLFRPFSVEYFLEALPQSCKNIAVLDRTKEPGATGEPLYLDVVQALSIDASSFRKAPKVAGGRYGLGSKEFTPAMVEAIFRRMKQNSLKTNFTVGICDDVSGLSLAYKQDFCIQTASTQVLFYETKSEHTTTSFQQLLDCLGHKVSHNLQGFMEVDYKKSNARSVSHLRISKTPIKAPFGISNADSVICDSLEFLENDVVLSQLKIGGNLLVKTSLSPEEFHFALSSESIQHLKRKQIRLYMVNASILPEHYAIDTDMVSGLHSCFFALHDEVVQEEVATMLKGYLTKIETGSLIPKEENKALKNVAFDKTLLGQLLRQKTHEIPVSAMPVDGTYPTNTSGHNKRKAPMALPIWNPDACVQCGACSMACPQASLRIKAYDDDYLDNAPETFKWSPVKAPEWQSDLLQYTLQIHPDQCTSCNHCIDACDHEALKMSPSDGILTDERTNWAYFEELPELDRAKINPLKLHQQQLQEPLFKYAMGVDGCGEAPYLKLLSQLFGDRLLIANATGASSIFGGALPTTPWSKNAVGRGPAWSNSLFEDNAEFGLGFRLSLDQQLLKAKRLLKQLLHALDFNLVYDILLNDQSTEIEIMAQRKSVHKLKEILKKLNIPKATALLQVADSLVKQSVWIVGGDGWAYDIGYGGLDHVIASGKNVNILVLDNEVYSNTGGQMSKATPFGASAKFATEGKQKQKKDLGRLLMCYDDVYVASVAMGADKEQTLKTFSEAESFNGPSIIIAYCHSPSHGIDMQRPRQYHRAAVDSGQWLLYRNDPRRREKGLPSLQLDAKAPSIPIKTYLRMETRFNTLFKKNPKDAEEMLLELQEKIEQRYQSYAAMTLPNMHPYVEKYN
ncbi:thiamine pyrophosphate-dependent enzyme [Spongiimicrobium salis]|uniref:thiamine pyrophosphate-dependent enzyme n=1 Tax=Spongiimicrobium salis TaxID=1667022 RepID=UPI00374D8D9B